jgi:hypothetical protein
MWNVPGVRKFAKIAMQLGVPSEKILVEDKSPNTGSDKVTVFIPGGPPDRGKGYLPSETWIYHNGDVTKARRGNEAERHILDRPQLSMQKALH